METTNLYISQTRVVHRRITLKTTWNKKIITAFLFRRVQDEVDLNSTRFASQYLPTYKNDSNIFDTFQSYMHHLEN